jgi:hypothetical protein
MLHRLRKLRAVPLLLALASPALGGGLLPWLRPCTMDMPHMGVLAPATGMAGHGSPDASPGEHPGSSHGPCTCPLSCAAAAAPILSGSGVLLPVARFTQVAGRRSMVEPTGPTSSSRFLLPYATAPPAGA